MRKFSTFVVKQRLWITVAFAVCLVAAIVGIFFVEVNYADTVYLPPQSSLKQGLDTMYSEFGEGGNATVMLSGADIEEMMDFKKDVEAVDGVSSVIWLDDIFLSDEIGVIKAAIERYNNTYGANNPMTDAEAIKFLMHLIDRMQYLSDEQKEMIADMNFDDSTEALKLLNTLNEGLTSAEKSKFNSFLLALQNSIPSDGSMSFDITMLEDFAPQLEMFYWNDVKRGEYALFQISFVESDYATSTMNAIGVIRELSIPEGCTVRIIGNAATTYNSIQSVNSETGKSMIVAGVIVIIILLLTTTAYWEPVLLLLTIGVAILLNMGTNGIVGYITGVNGISYMTQGVSSVLQLALTMDYSIYLLHRFKQERRGGISSEEAMINALTASFSPISASSLTTIASFVALMFMSYRLGLDMGLVLAKGVVLSIVSVFLLMPALILYSEKLINKTEHKTFNMTFQKFSKGLIKTRFYVPFIILALIIPCIYFQAQNTFTYGPEASLGGEGSALYQDKLEIEEVFGKQNQAIVLMPIKYLNDDAYEIDGNKVSTEYMLSMKLMEVDGVSSVQSYSLIDETGFASMMPDKFLNQFIPATDDPGYSRVVLFLDADEEGDPTTALIDNINGVIAQYTAGDAWLLGQSSATLEIKDLVNFDYDTITYVSIGLVALILFVTFKSILIPIIQVLVIQGSIYINMAVPYFMRDPLVFVGYMLVSSILLGATIDYAILLTSRYMEHRRTMNKYDAVQHALADSSRTLITSAGILTCAGASIQFVSSLPATQIIGGAVMRGGIASYVMVMVPLPQLLLLLDKAIKVTTWKGKQLMIDNRIVLDSPEIEEPSIGQVSAKPRKRKLYRDMSSKEREDAIIANILNAIDDPDFNPEDEDT